jgi:hypothetical protein
MEVSVQIHAQIALAPIKEPPLHTEYEAEWDSAGMDAFENRQISYS